MVEGLLVALSLLWPAAAPAAAEASAPAPMPPPLVCAGSFVQGGIALCRTTPGAVVTVDSRAHTQADEAGFALVGFDRDSPAQAVIEAVAPDGGAARVAYDVTQRQFSIQRVDGLPPQTVTPTEPAVLDKIQRDNAVKAKARESRAAMRGWLDGFRWPVTGSISGAWGNQRILNGEPRPPHFGVDIAAPTGTPILAPAAGVVVLAEPDLHFEGGMVVIDHGQGLLSYYLHMSRIDVGVGRQVAQGEPLGAVGATGRATGPHLCWRMRWRDRNVDPSIAPEALAAAKATFAAAP